MSSRSRPKKIKVRGRTYSYAFETDPRVPDAPCYEDCPCSKEKLLGYCTVAPPYRITIDAKLRRRNRQRRLLAVAAHETLHAALPDLGEPAIRGAEDALVAVLYDWLGFRLPED